MTSTVLLVTVQRDAARENGGPAGTVPPRLRPGDRVAVVSPSGPVPADRLAAGCRWLRGLGLDVVVGPHARDRTGFLAGTDADRAADLRDAWRDPGIAAVLCARGGYGAARLLDRLDWAALAAAPPTLLHGSSDITALHAAFAAHLRVSTSFGPMVASLLAEPDAETDAAARAALLDGAPWPAVRGTDALVPGRAAGVLTGGNLSLLASLAGTGHLPATRGAILLLEDVHESPYRIDRMLTQLRQAGVLDGVAGIALGGWTECGEPAEVRAVLDERLSGLGVPVLAGLPVGHGAPQHTVPLGARVVLDTGTGTLEPGPPAG